jgi:hypothetical protein
VLHVLACALTLGWMPAGRIGETNPIPRVAAQAVLVFALYQFAATLIPWGWSLADQVAQGISHLVSLVLPWPLSVGPTFAGLDYLVLSLAFCFLLIRKMDASGKTALALRWAGMILLAHMVYLFLLAAFPKWRQWLPEISVKSAFPGLPGKTKPLGDAILWQLPLLGLVLHLPLLALAARRFGRHGVQSGAAVSTPGVQTHAKPRERSGPQSSSSAQPWFGPLRRVFSPTTVATLGLALAVPVLTLLQPKPLSLQGRKIVVYEKGFLNWLKPQHGEYGRLTVGMYGIWPTFFEKYGGRCVISPELSANDLESSRLSCRRTIWRERTCSC